GQVAGGSGYAIEIERALAFRAAECSLRLYDPIDALTRIESSLDRSLPGTLEEKKRWVALWVDAARDAGKLAPARLEAQLSRLGIPEDVGETMRRRANKEDATRIADSSARSEALHTVSSGDT